MIEVYNQLQRVHVHSSPFARQSPKFQPLLPAQQIMVQHYKTLFQHLKVLILQTCNTLNFMGAQSAFFRAHQIWHPPRDSRRERSRRRQRPHRDGHLSGHPPGHPDGRHPHCPGRGRMVGQRHGAGRGPGGMAGHLCPVSDTATNPNQPIDWNPISSTWRMLARLGGERIIYLPILGISWFWFLGASLLALPLPFRKDVLGGSESLVTFFLALFSIGIGLGSILCERLSKGRLELGLVPIGSIGMTIFTMDLLLAGAPSIDGAFTLKAFLSTVAGLRISVDILMLSVFGGCYIVPLMTMIQQRSAPEHRASVIAGCNIVNAFFMVLSALFLYRIEHGLARAWIFLILALMNAAIALYIYLLIPEIHVPPPLRALANVLYRLRLEGEDNIPSTGPVALASNHVTFVDWLLIAGACHRPARFVMHHSFMKMPLARWFFKGARVIPIASAKESPTVLKAAMDSISEALANGEVVCIFPEGQITRDGNFNEFRAGIEHIVARNPAPVIPIALLGLAGSWFSRKEGRAMSGSRSYGSGPGRLADWRGNSRRWTSPPPSSRTGWGELDGGEMKLAEEEG